MILKLILASALSFSNPPKNKSLNYLEKRLEKQGYDISYIVEDPRFEIYSFKRKKFVNYADTTKSWYMKKDSLEACADFLEEYKPWLEKAEKEFGPSPEHIVSQLELETNRGQFLGKRPVINSLISVYLYSYGHRRRRFYTYIKEFLKIQQDTTDNIILPKDIFDAKGSWAGAYGLPQIMPNLFRSYGKDFDGDGYFDAMNTIDAIGFLAHYLSEHGFSEDKLKATHDYNSGHPFYASSVGKHALALHKIMEQRERKFISSLKPLKPIEAELDPPISVDLKSINKNFYLKNQPKQSKKYFKKRFFHFAR